MIDKLDRLISELEELTNMLWKNEKAKFFENYKVVLADMMEVIPLVIAGYSHHKMDDIKDDAMYWPGQVSKIIDLIGKGNDVIAISDALFFEMRANLIEYRDVLIEREVEL